MKKSRTKNITDKVIDMFDDDGSLKTDPNGSYTGRPIDKYDQPIQDADDL